MLFSCFSLNDHQEHESGNLLFKIAHSNSSNLLGHRGVLMSRYLREGKGGEGKGEDGRKGEEKKGGGVKKGRREGKE